MHKLPGLEFSYLPAFVAFGYLMGVLLELWFARREKSDLTP